MPSSFAASARSALTYELPHPAADAASAALVIVVNWRRGIVLANPVRRHPVRNGFAKAHPAMEIFAARPLS